ncbi:MAG TPA: hypothetical protein VGI83_10300 [Gemmatimonadales bacterium]|jgi:hypothetical protein
MRPTSPFDHEPDRELGRALRDLLESRDDAAFTRRVLGVTPWPQVGVGDWWDVLGGWSRPGLAAAVLLAAVAGFWMGRSTNGTTPMGLEEALLPRVTTAALDTVNTPPDLDVLTASFGNER